jgi:hypothetical protein
MCISVVWARRCVPCTTVLLSTVEIDPGDCRASLFGSVDLTLKGATKRSTAAKIGRWDEEMMGMKKNGGEERFVQAVT